MRSFRRFLTLASAAALATAVFLGARPAAATNYAVCVGVNQYESSYASSAGLSTLKGCVPDAKHMTNVITKRGEWDKANVTLLTDSGATLTAIRQAVSNVATSARSGDTFFYYHSSHGGNDKTIWKTVNGEYYLYYGLDSTGEKHCICSYNADYTAKMLATDLASFPSDVRIVVMMDTCHSAGMFKYDMTKSGKTIQLTKKGETGNTSDGEDVSVIPPADDSAAGFFMEAVMVQLEQLEADQVRRGVRSRSAKSVASNTGWIAAADYDQYSLDNGTAGGAFTCAFIDGVTNQNKMCDNATYGNQDGYASFYEGWNYAKDIARGARDEDEWYYVPEDEDGYGGYWAYNWADPQCANSNLLDSVLVGWAGKTAPANVAPTFSSSTASATVVQNETLTYTFTATGYPAPTYTISTTASGYTFTGSTLSFTPTATGTYTFTCTAANGISPNATCTLTVTVTPPPPETPSEVSVVSSDSFTATWSAVSGASSYELVVLEGAASGSGTIVTETFANASFSTTSSSYANQTISGCDLGTWTATQCRGDYETPVVKATGTLTSPAITGGVASVEFDYVWPFSSDSSGTCDIDLYVDGTYKDSATVTAGTAGTASYTSFASVSGTPSIMFTNKATSNKRIRVTEVRIGTAGSRAKALPRAVGDVVYSNTVGNVTSFEVTGLQPETTYSYSVRAIVNGEPTGWSDSVTVTTTEGDAAPVWSDIPAQSVTVGATCTLTISDYVTGSPTPTITMTGSGASFDGSVFTFTPSATGDFTFTFTADNGVGDSQDASLTVTVSAAPVTVPTLTISDVDANSARASWTACDGVTSYTLQLASDDQFTTGGSGGSVTLFSNDGTDATAPTGWSYEIESAGIKSGLVLKNDDYVISESFDASSCTALSLTLEIRTYGGSSGTSDTLLVQYSTDDGTSWNTVGTVTASGKTLAAADPLDASVAAGNASVRLRFTDPGATSQAGVGIANIVLTGTQASGTGSLISSTTVNDTVYTFTGLTPNTTYYARVQGNDAWSEVKSFTTEAGADSAPEWSAIPAQTVTVGETCTLDLSGYVNGSPAPSITMAETVAGASLAETVFTFTPSALGAFTFTFTANNGIGSPASAPLTVNSTGTAPAVVVPQTTYSTSLGGDDVEFTVTGTGTPTPTLSLSHTATSGVTFDKNDGYFSFTPYATGTFTFTFSATSLAGDATPVVVTVNVSEAAVTVPVLTVSDVDSTSATASWTACDAVTEYTLQLSTSEFSAGAATITDTLTAAKFVLAGNSYGAGSYASVDSGAGYAAWAMKNGDAIQLKSKDNVSGIVVTNSAGSVSEVRVSFASTTSSNRTLNIYGSASAYPAPSALYTNSTAGELLGTIVYDGSTAAGSYTINGSYAFIGIRSASGAIYLDNVEIDWNPANGGTTSKGLAKDGGDGIQTFTVNDTSYEFADLTPETTYYARVKGTSDWSNVETFTTLAGADSAPVWSAIPAQNYLFGSNNGTFEFNVAPYASGSPAPAFYLGDTQWTAYVGDGTGDFIFEPDALGTFDFTVIASNTLGTANATLSVTVTAAPPAFVDLPATVTGYAGEDVAFTVVASGNPAPVLGVDAADGLLFTFNDSTGEFMFNSDNTGNFEFEFTAANIAATVTQTVTVTISAAPVTVPVLTVTNVTDTTALASWTACDGVTEYTLQLSTNDFPAAAGASRDITTLLSESFESGIPTTWSKNNVGTATGKGGDGDTCLAFKGVGAYVLIGGLESPSGISFMYKRSGNDTAWGLDLYVGSSADGPWTPIGSIDSAETTWNNFATNFTASGTSFIKLVDTRTTGSHERYLDLLAITAGSSGGGDDPGGDDVQEFRVAGTSYEITGLEPETFYYARVKGNAGWSESVAFLTDSLYVAPEFSEHAIPATGTVGDTLYFNFEDYLDVVGNPAAEFIITPADLPDEIAGGLITFTPTAAGEYEFTCVATNAAGYDTCVLTVTVSGGETPLTPFEQWLADNGYGTHDEGEIAENGQTYKANYIADIDPGSTNELDIVFSNGQFTVNNASVNRYYQFIYSTNLKDGFTGADDLGKPTALPLVITPPDAANWFGRIKVTVEDPTP